MLPDTIRGYLAHMLPAPISRVVPVGGGDISRAVRISSGAAEWLLKWNTAAPPQFFAAEADGLTRLRHAAALPVPRVLAHAERDGERPAFIMLEWFAATTRYDPAELGTGLAVLHRHTAERYGLERANFIGSLPQPNQQHDDWATFWRTQRLQPQITLADQAGQLNTQRLHRLERLSTRLDDLLSHRPAAALLHGDLWSGNVITAPDGRPALIDPAVSYGDRETDLAFAALFGGFGAQFEWAYSAAYPLPSDALDRRPLYQLYWLLVHLTLFGQSYGAAVDRVLTRYVGP